LAKTQEEKQKVIRDIQRFKMEARKYKGAIAPIRKISLKQSSIQTGEAFRVLRKDDGSKPMEGIFRFPGKFSSTLKFDANTQVRNGKIILDSMLTAGNKQKRQGRFDPAFLLDKIIYELLLQFSSCSPQTN
jgi:hypothetical protein